MNGKSSITDSPRNVSKGERDNFGIEPFENGLTRFINNSNTPITVALQGEWGSGKTSLMNSLKKSLSDGENSKFHSIWLNTWEYALMKDAQTTLMDIITGLIQETSKIAKVDETKTKKILNTLWGGIKNTSKVVAKNTLDKAVDGAGSMIDAFSSQSKSSISEVRTQLEEIIEECIKKDNKDGFIFFIDDLDRIDPPIAVQLLELLKNIFTLKNCVFVLAIDYDVVIKGLEPKFGKLSELNEREFRSFFDKIIQVPFSMPVSSYNIDDFLKESLLTINYISEADSKNNELISKFSEISNLSVGKNPRALKRLMNSLSLISCINTAKGNDQESDQLNEELELLVNFALVSIQIAYPPVYRLLSLHSAFDKWNESVALQMNLNPLDQQSIEKLSQSEEFDEEWEQVLFRLCENDHYLKKRALNVSRLLNSLKIAIIEKEEEIEDVIEAVISLSSVTNLEALDKPVVDYHKGDLLKKVRDGLFKVKGKKIPNIEQVGTRIQSNFKFKVDGYHFEVKSTPSDGGIRLTFKPYAVQVGAGKGSNDFRTLLKNKGLTDEFDKIANEYNEYRNSLPDSVKTRDLYKVGTWKNNNYVDFILEYQQVKPEDFYKDESIELLSNHLIKSLTIKKRVLEVAEKIKKTV